MKINSIKLAGTVLLGATALGIAFNEPNIKPAQAKTGAKIVWQPSFEKALATAKRTGRPIMVDFYAEWCGPCKMLDREVWPQASVVQESRNWIAVKVDGDKRPDLLKRYAISGFPTIAFLKPDGNISKTQVGIMIPPNLQSKPKQRGEFMGRAMAKTMRSERLKAVVRSA